MKLRSDSIRIWGAVAALAVLAAVVAGATAPPAAADPTPSCAPSVSGFDLCSVTYAYTGNEQQFHVPSNLVGGSIVVEAIGAAGQNGNRGSVGTQLTVNGLDCWSTYAFSDPSGGGTPGSGGRGADVSGSVAASPGQTLYVEVGGTASFSQGSFIYTLRSTGGWNGGGKGGSGTTNAGNCGGFGGGGGGASAVQTCSLSTGACTGSYGTAGDPRLIVAAGGAGGGGSGADGSSLGFSGGGAGAAGTGDGTTFVKGGNAGTKANGNGAVGGVSGTAISVGGGGGGGGGYAGGGGGDPGSVGGGAGGGGGSNHVPSGGSQTLSSSSAEVVITYFATLPTSLTVSANGVYGAASTLTATLTTRGAAVPGRSITFTSSGGTTLCGVSGKPACPITDGSGTATLSSNLGLVGAGQGNTASASFAGDSSFASSAATGPSTVTKAGSLTTVVCPGAPFVYNNGAHGCTATWATTSGDAGTGAVSAITYTGRNGTTYNSTSAPVAAGDYTATATFAGDANHTGSSGTADFSTSKAGQSIIFPKIGAQTVGASLTTGATTTAGLPVLVSSSTTGVCSVASGIVNLVAPGTCTLTASQPGDANHNPAVPVTQSFAVASKNLIKDGGFESPKKATGSATTISPPKKIGAYWKVTAGSVDLVNSYWQNAAGAQSVDLAGLAPGTLSQTVTLPATATYTLKFKYAGNPEGLPVTKHMTVTANAPSWGSPVSVAKVFDTTSTTIAAMGWKAGTLTFSGTAGDVVTITFQDTDSATANGMTLDAVSMKAS